MALASNGPNTALAMLVFALYPCHLLGMDLCQSVILLMPFYFACIVRCIGLCHYYQGIKRMEKGSRNWRKPEIEESHFMLHYKNLSSGV